MPRIRSLHPDQWTDLPFVSCTPLARLLALGLRNFADDNGIIQLNPVGWKIQILPADSCDIHELIFELLDHDILRYYEADGREFVEIQGFSVEQKPKKPSYQHPTPPWFGGKPLKNLPNVENSVMLKSRQFRTDPPVSASQFGTEPPLNAPEFRTDPPVNPRQFGTEPPLNASEFGTEGKKPGSGEKKRPKKPKSAGQSGATAVQADLVDQQTLEVGSGSQSQDPSQSLSPPPKGTPPLTQKSQVVEVFEFWQEVMTHPRAKLDQKRDRIIRVAMKAGYSVQDLKQAITGCSLTAHNMGQNDRGEKYDGLHVILRPENIDRFMANAVNPPQYKPARASGMDKMADTARAFMAIGEDDGKG